MMKNTDLNQITEPQEIIKSGGCLNEFLWTFAGVNKPILRQCPNEYAKYAGMGGTILGTAIMAAISGAYAVNFVFEDTLIAIVFGIFWGILILNLDRFIVSTMYSDGKHTVSWQELKSGLPRIIMAIFLGIVISTPLEMKLFEERIMVQIEYMNQEQIANYKAHQVDTDNLDEYKQQIDEIEDEIRRRQLDIESQRMALDKEEMGLSASGKPGRGPAYATKRENLGKSERELEDYKRENKERLKGLRNKIALIENDRNTDAKRYDQLLAEDGFCKRYEAFARIDDGNLELTIVIWFIRMLFIIIEVAPVFFRMMIASGSYDELLRTTSIYISKMAEKQNREITEEYETEIKINTERNRIRLEAENQANKDLYYGIANAQSEVIATAINNWKQQELKKVAKDPSAYIKIG